MRLHFSFLAMIQNCTYVFEENHTCCFCLFCMNRKFAPLFQLVSPHQSLHIRRYLFYFCKITGFHGTGRAILPSWRCGAKWGKLGLKKAGSRHFNVPFTCTLYMNSNIPNWYSCHGANKDMIIRGLLQGFLTLIHRTRHNPASRVQAVLKLVRGVCTWELITH